MGVAHIPQGRAFISLWIYLSSLHSGLSLSLSLSMESGEPHKMRAFWNYSSNAKVPSFFYYCPVHLSLFLPPPYHPLAPRPCLTLFIGFSFFIFASQKKNDDHMKRGKRGKRGKKRQTYTHAHV